MSFFDDVIACPDRDAAINLFEQCLENDEAAISEYVENPGKASRAFTSLARKAGRGHKGDIREFERSVKAAAQARASAAQGSHPTVSVFESLQDLPPARMIAKEKCRDVNVPFGYVLNDSGVFRLKMENDEPIEVPLLPDPVFICGTTRDSHTNDRILFIAYKDLDFCWNQFSCTLEDIGNPTKLLALAKHGIPINNDNKQQVMKYLALSWETNRRRLPNSVSTPKMGWTEEETPRFVFPDVTLEKGEYRTKMTFKAKAGDYLQAAAFRQQGTMQDAFRIIEIVRPYPVPMFAIGHALAGFMLDLLKPRNVRPSMLDIGSKTGHGKSVTLALYTWVSGRPGFTAENAGISWDISPRAFEEKAGFYGSVPMAVDETKLQLTKYGHNFAVKNLTKCAYTWYNGQGFARLNKDGSQRTAATWLTNAAISGEETLTRMVQDNEGARARLIPIEEYPFGEQSAQAASDIRQLERLLPQYYGILGREFVKLLMTIREKNPQMVLALFDSHRERAQSLGHSSVGTRVATYIAAVMTALDLAHDYMKLPRPDVSLWELVKRIMKNVNYQADRADIALRQLVEHLQANPNNVINIGASQYSQLWAAWPDNKRDYIVVSRSKLEQFMRDAGHSYRSTVADWFKKGYIALPAKKTSYKTRGFDEWVDAACGPNVYTLPGGMRRTINGFRIKEGFIRELLSSHQPEIVEPKTPEQVTETAAPQEQTVVESKVPW